MLVKISLSQVKVSVPLNIMEIKFYEYDNASCFVVQSQTIVILFCRI